MKSGILLHTTLAQGGIQAVDEKTQSDIEVPDYLKTFLKLALQQVILTLCGKYRMSIS